MKGKKSFGKYWWIPEEIGFTKTHISSETNNEQSHNNNLPNIGSYKENLKSQDTRARRTIVFLSQFMFWRLIFIAIKEFDEFALLPKEEQDLTSDLTVFYSWWYM